MPIPYRRYPNRMELQSHTGLAAWEPGWEGETGRAPDPRTLFAWNYELRLAHRTAAQDTITIELFHDRVVLAGEGRTSFGTPWRVTSIFGRRCGATCPPMWTHLSSGCARWLMSLPSTMEDGDQPSERFAFTLERDRGCIAVVENTLRYVPGLALETADSSFTELRYDNEQRVYMLPENYSGEVLRCKLTCMGYHIAEENITNAAVTVTRNANIPGIAPVFVYRTPTYAFPVALLPSLTLTNPIALGPWSRDSFIGRLRELWSGFGTVSVELLYGRRLAEDLYARLPILYAPGISTGNPARLGELFEGVEEWRRGRIAVTEEDFIQCGLVFYSAQDPAYNLVEVRELRFTL